MAVRKKKAVVAGEKVDGQIRLALGVLTGYLASKGFIGQPEVDLAMALAPAVIASVWSWQAKPKA